MPSGGGALSCFWSVNNDSSVFLLSLLTPRRAALVLTESSSQLVIPTFFKSDREFFCTAP